MDFNTLHYADTLPYPPIKAECPNPQYAAAILSNIGSCNSEMSAVSLYFYNSLVTRQSNEDIAQCFHKISLVEMHHLEIFGQLALELGADPRLWSPNKGRMYYWSPGCNHYPNQPVPLLNNAMAAEQEAIRKYQTQAEWIPDPHIRAILNRVIMDETLHVHILKELLKEVTAEPSCGKGLPPDLPGTTIPAD